MSIINTNVASQTANRFLAMNQQKLDFELRKLATGVRINRGADDPAGLVAAEQLRAERTAIDAQVRAAERSEALATVADGSLSELSGMLGRLDSLAVTAANSGALSDAEKAALQMEADSIVQSVDRISSRANFNGTSLFDGSFELRADGESQALSEISSTSLGDGTGTVRDIASGGSLSLTGGDFAAAQSAIRAAITQISTERGAIGSFQKNTIAASIRSKSTAFVNLSAAESVIRDTDFGKATADAARFSVLTQASLGAAAIANSEPARVLDLLG